MPSAITKTIFVEHLCCKKPQKLAEMIKINDAF
jgi:hypothetical protein